MSRLALLPLAMLVFACSGVPTALTEVDEPPPSFRANGNSGCYKVEIFEEDDFVGPSELTGDLVGGGTYPVIGPTKSGGVADHYDYIASWDITSSPGVPGFAPVTLEVHFDNHMYLAAPGQAPYNRTNGKVRIDDESVKKGNLTFHGTFDANVFLLEVTYKGTICLN